MLTVYDFNRITFAHHRGIVPPMPAHEGKKAVEKRYVCSANMKLMEYGYIMARDLFDACCKAEYNDFLKTWSALYDCVTEDGKATSQTSPANGSQTLTRQNFARHWTAAIFLL